MYKMVIFINKQAKKTKEMRKDDKETGEKKRINILVSEEKKNAWDAFAENNHISTISKLIRNAVDLYINVKPKLDQLETYSKSVHNLKEELSSIKGFSQLLIEQHKDELSWEALLKIKEIIDKSANIEKILNDISNTHKLRDRQYDILIVDDDSSTINLISNYFKKKGYSLIDTSLGNQAIELLKKITPKLILLDILLPDVSGYEICKKIKTREELKNIPIFYITAVPEAEVQDKMSETKANGYFLKPFNISDFNILLNYL